MYVDEYECLSRYCDWRGKHPNIEGDIAGVFDIYCPRCGCDVFQLAECPHCRFRGMLDWEFEFYADDYDSIGFCPECGKKAMEVKQVAYERDPDDDYDMQ